MNRTESNVEGYYRSVQSLSGNDKTCTDKILDENAVREIGSRISTGQEKTTPRQTTTSSQETTPAFTTNEVNGTVLEIHDDYVVCEIQPESGFTVHINLPNSLFPEEIHYAYPFKLSMINESGFRKPVVTSREVDPGAFAAERAAVQTIIDKL